MSIKEPGVPSEDLIFLVAGHRNPDVFLATGFGEYLLINKTLASVGQKPKDEFRGRVLDFGCGVGRVARHWDTRADKAELYGTDFQKILIDWCNENLTGSFQINNLFPPLDYPDEMFDLVYAISVFTHFNINLQFLWANEIHRILKPGGIAILTAHGSTVLPTCFNRQLNTPNLTMKVTQLSNDYILEQGEELGMNDYAIVNGMMAFRAIVSHFELLAYYPCYGLSGFQDTYVLQKKEPIEVLSYIKEVSIPVTDHMGEHTLAIDSTNEAEISFFISVEETTVRHDVQLQVLTMNDQFLAEQDFEIRKELFHATGLTDNLLNVTLTVKGISIPQVKLRFRTADATGLLVLKYMKICGQKKLHGNLLRIT